MKKILLYFGVIIIALAISVFASIYMPNHKERYHQHIEDIKTSDCSHTGSEKFCTNLPIVIIDTNGMQVPRPTNSTETLPVNVILSIIDNGFENNHLDDEHINDEQASIYIRGNSSRYFDKSSYKVNFENEEGIGNRVAVLGMSADDEWILNGPFLDKTLMRNYMCYNIAGEIMEYAPNVRFCELFINDTYQGVYVFTENIERSKDRIDVSGINEKLNKTGYIVRLDRGEHESKNINNFMYYSYKIGLDGMFNIVYPSYNNLTNELKEYIEKDMSEFEKSLYSFDYNDKNYGYVNYIDISSFVDYFIINEFFINGDAGSYSTYLYKDIGQKFKLCVWDFNNACDNYMETAFNEEGFFMTEKPWYYMLIKDKDFVERIIWRYKELRKTVLSEEYLINYIESTASYLKDATNRNYEVWGYSFNLDNLDGYNRLYPEERNLRSYEESIEQLKSIIIKRGNWLDENIDSLLQYCHESRIKKFIH